MLCVPLNMVMSAAHCQGISECLESGHSVLCLSLCVAYGLLSKTKGIEKPKLA